MKKYRWAKNFIHSFVLAVWLAASVVVPAHASAASMYITPAARSIAQSTIIAMNVRMNGGGASVNAVQANIAYPTDKLQYINTFYSGSAFEIQAESTWGGGVVRIARGTLNPISGDALIAVVSFKVLASSGSASLSFTSDSTLASNGAEVPSSKSGASMSFTPAPVFVPAAPAPELPKDTTPPVISNLQEKSVTAFSATISWTTDEDANATVEYSLDASYGLSVSAAALTKTHELTLPTAVIEPKTTYKYRVKSADAAGNVQTSEPRSFTTPGVPVLITVLSSRHTPVSSATVSLDGTTGVTNNQGMVTLPSGLGKKQATAQHNGSSITQNLTVLKPADGKPPQSITLTLAPKTVFSGGTWQLLALIFGAGLVVLLILDAYLFRTRLFLISKKLHGRFGTLKHQPSAVMPAPISLTHIEAAHHIDGIGALPVLNPEQPLLAAQNSLPALPNRPAVVKTKKRKSRKINYGNKL